KGDVVHRLRGMFAFAIWDAREQSLFLARDRFGEKPLFLREQGGSLYFASEIKSLLEIPGVARTVDLESVWQYLAYRYVPGPATRRVPVWRYRLLRNRGAHEPPACAAEDVLRGFPRGPLQRAAVRSRGCEALRDGPPRVDRFARGPGQSPRAAGRHARRTGLG